MGNQILYSKISRLAVIFLIPIVFVIIDAKKAAGVSSHYQDFDQPDGKGVSIDIPIDPDNPETFTHTISHPGSMGIFIHFDEFELADGDTVSISSPDGRHTLTYPGGPIMTQSGQPGFWTSSIPGDSLIIQYQKNSSGDDTGQIHIDYYLYDLNNPGIVLEGLIGSDDKEDVECYSGAYYSGDYQTEYAKSKMVAIILELRYVDPDGDGPWPLDWYLFTKCSAWRVHPLEDMNGLMMTNNHCIADATELDSMVFRFFHQYTGCGGDVWANYIDLDQTRTEFIATSDADTGDDWTLISADITGIQELYQSWMYLSLNPREPVFHEQIYIPQHPGDTPASPKKLAIFDSENTDTGFCRIDDVLYDSFYYDPDIETGYKCDTFGGSSGSPVLSTDEHRVIALHHATDDGTSPTINLGIRIDKIWDDINNYIKPDYIDDIYASFIQAITMDTFTFYWDEEPTADFYRLIFDHETDGIVYQSAPLPTADVCTDGECSYSPPYNYPNGDYSFTVKGINDAGQGGADEWQTFHITIAAPKPLLISPFATINDLRPTYHWYDMKHTDDYRLYVSNPVVGNVINEWLPTGDVCSLGQCEYQSDVHLRTGNHVWWVQGRNEMFGGGEWSDQKGFRIFNSTPPDESLVVTSHTHRETISEIQPNLTWNEVQRASWYKVYISDNTGKLYNQYHKTADICYGTTCTLDWATYSPLFEVSRSITDFPTDTWIHFYAMPVNVAGNGSWTGPVDFRIETE